MAGLTSGKDFFFSEPYLPLRPPLGAAVGPGEVSFWVWAPHASRLELVLFSGREEAERRVLQSERDGYFSLRVPGLGPGANYAYSVDGSPPLPDPASRYQPEGVHGPSQVVDLAFPWTDSEWKGMPLEKFIIYELHIGTFTPEGTFDAACERLGYLKELGVTAVEVMPVAQFPGTRNWGYDGAQLFAVQNSYGGPTAFQRFVNACHEHGLAVILDVVYNHLGPEGNYLHQYGPYFTDKYKTPWGPAINYDGRGSDAVRHFVISNSLQWVCDFHVDALRLDAVHGIFDFSAKHILAEVKEAVDEAAARLGRAVYVIAESDLNDVRIIEERGRGGYGLDAQWSDDLHHSIHALLTGERDGYYLDFGSPAHLAKALAKTFVYDGCYSLYRQRRHGSDASQMPGNKFVVCMQNHDQVGNRLLGERISTLVSREAQRLAAALVLCSPYIPLIFMGEEYGEQRPFLYFISHGDEALARAVREGRRREFSAFQWKGEMPDPQAEQTFLASKLNWAALAEERHREHLAFYKRLIELRKNHPALSSLSKERMKVELAGNLLFVKRWSADGRGLLLCYNLSDVPSSLFERASVRSSRCLMTSYSESGEPEACGELLRPYEFRVYEF